MNGKKQQHIENGRRGEMIRTSVNNRPNILIVEDDLENQKYLELILKQQFNVDFCDSSTGFFDFLLKKQYSAIILDVKLKGERNGIELTREMRRSVQFKNIPIMALSAHVFSQDRLKALEAGVSVYLTKPVSNKILIETLTKLI